MSFRIKKSSQLHAGMAFTIVWLTAVLLLCACAINRPWPGTMPEEGPFSDEPLAEGGLPEGEAEGSPESEPEEADGEEGTAEALADMPREEFGPIQKNDGISALPAYPFTSGKAEGYTNAESGMIRYVVYVETDYDTDGDGKRDLVKTIVQLPRAALEGEYKASVIYEARPYSPGMQTAKFGIETLPRETDFTPESLYVSPPARIPEREADTKEAARLADPSDWYYQTKADRAISAQTGVDLHEYGTLDAYDYFLCRGYAVVQTGGLGTYGSEGICCTGLEAETAAAAAVIEWLTGDRPAFLDKEGTVLIRADWCSGRVGMIGRSYAGAIAYQTATTGVKGLKTIVPIAGIAGWYNYVNSQGIDRKDGHYGFLHNLSAVCSAGIAEGQRDKQVEERLRSFLSWESRAQSSLQGDYGPFWELVDYHDKTEKLKASALIIQGLNDSEVFPGQAELMRQAFREAGCKATLFLHQNGHISPADEETHTEILYQGELFEELLNKWFSHYLLGLDNGADAWPEAIIQSNLDGSFSVCEELDAHERREFIPEGGKTKVTSRLNHSLTEDILSAANGTADAHTECWTFDQERPLEIRGRGEVQLRIALADASAKEQMLSALLVDESAGNFDAFVYTPGQFRLPNLVVRRDGAEKGEGTEPYDLVEWGMTSVRKKLITQGHLDLRDPQAGLSPESAMQGGEKPESGVFRDYVLYLEPTCYTVAPGHQLRLYLTGYQGNALDVAAAMAAKRGLPGERDFSIYSFTIDRAESRLILPAAAEDKSP